MQLDGYLPDPPREREHELRHLRARAGVRHHVDEVVDPYRQVKVERQQPVGTA